MLVSLVTVNMRANVPERKHFKKDYYYLSVYVYILSSVQCMIIGNVNTSEKVFERYCNCLKNIEDF